MYYFLSIAAVCLFEWRWIFGNGKKESSLKVVQDVWVLYKQITREI